MPCELRAEHLPGALGTRPEGVPREERLWTRRRCDSFCIRLEVLKKMSEIMARRKTDLQFEKVAIFRASNAKPCLRLMGNG